MKHRTPMAAIPKFLRTHSKVGAAPGTLQHVGERRVKKMMMEIWNYNTTSFQKTICNEVKEIEKATKKTGINWINVIGVHNSQKIEQIGNMFSLHPLMLEDILNTTQRPKIEEYDNSMFIVVKMLHHDEEKNNINVEQISFVLLKNTVISFQEQKKDVFDPIRERIESGIGKLRTQGADYLLYRLVDAICDGYFTVLEEMGDDVEKMEEHSMKQADDQFISSVYNLRRQTLFVRKAVYPLRDVIGRLERAESEFIDESTSVYFRDVYDHTIQATDAVDTFRDLLGTILDNYLSVMSHKMNTVMKVLTIMASIFIPLTFIAGIYGMNFEYMPELTWKWGYPTVWIVMITITAGLLAFFKKKKWI